MIPRPDTIGLSWSENMDNMLTSSPSYLNTPRYFGNDSHDYNYAEINYPSSIYSLTADSDTESEVMFPLQNTTPKTEQMSVDKFLSTDDNPFGRSPTDLEEDVKTPQAIETGSDSSCINEESPTNSVEPYSDSLTDELESYSYSHPELSPSDSLMSPGDYTNPYSQADNALFSSTDSRSDYEFDVKPTCLERRNYDTASLMYENDDMTTFTGLVNCNDVLQNSNKRFNTSDYEAAGSNANFNLNSSATMLAKDFFGEWSRIRTDIIPGRGGTLVDENTVEELSMEDSKKGKISGLQRRALDSIFEVTDRPSRGLVLHIACELRLHHITVKNFFSNGRRRLRRAAARLNDPERTRRENQRRKEKRRLAALAAAAAAANGEQGQMRSSCTEGNEGQSKEPTVLSPERRALMEKLAVKVQRSVAQKSLTALAETMNSTFVMPSPVSQNTPQTLEESLHSNSLPNSPARSEDIFTTQIQQVEEVTDGEENIFVNEEELAAMMSFGTPANQVVSENTFATPLEQDQYDSYDSSLGQDNKLAFYMNQDQNTSSVTQLSSQDDGPFSPTSWQTLIQT